MSRFVLPPHLRMLVGVGREIELDMKGAATQRAVLDALERRHPMLRRTLWDPATGRRRPFVRFFACQEDLSHESPDARLSRAVFDGVEPFMVIGGLAGG